MPERPLEALSALLGVPVADVRQTSVWRDGQGPITSANAWRLELPTARYGLDSAEWTGGPCWSQTVRSSEFRSEWRLNHLARTWGRDPALPDLTRADGRRVLALCHQHIESNGGKTA